MDQFKQIQKGMIFNRCTCIDNTASGDGVVKIEGRVVFVRNLIKGEIADIKILKANKKYCFAKFTNLIKPSPSRAEFDICSAYPMCGGCDLLHMNYDLQLEVKKNQVINNFKKYANEDIEIYKVVSGKQFNYRNNSLFPVQFVDGKYSYGFYRSKSNDIVQHYECVNHDKEINTTIKDITIELNKTGVDYFINHIVIRKVDQGVSVLFVVNKKSELKDFIKENFDYFEMAINLNTANTNKVIDGPITFVTRTKPTITLSDIKFEVSPTSFFQSNILLTPTLYQEALADYKLGNASELYCGTGTITILGAKSADQITGCDITPSSIQNAKANAFNNGIENVTFTCQDATEFFDQSKDEFDSLILDPPRKGLTSKIIEKILQSNIKRIIYISCDPATLARDYNMLKEEYKIERYKMVDMFPNTKHIESILILTKNKL